MSAYLAMLTFIRCKWFSLPALSNKAEQTLLKGLKIDEKNESLLYALVYHFFNNGEKNKAKNSLKKLIEYYPRNMQYKNLFTSLD